MMVWSKHVYWTWKPQSAFILSVLLYSKSSPICSYHATVCYSFAASSYCYLRSVSQAFFMVVFPYFLIFVPSRTVISVPFLLILCSIHCLFLCRIASKYFPFLFILVTIICCFDSFYSLHWNGVFLCVYRHGYLALNLLRTCNSLLAYFTNICTFELVVFSLPLISYSHCD